jgi:hypothetical protein
MPNIKKIRDLNLPGTPWATSACCGRPLLTFCIRNACRITNAINTHSDYVIIIAFPLQKRLRERASILRYTYIACLAVDKFRTAAVGRLQTFSTHLCSPKPNKIIGYRAVLLGKMEMRSRERASKSYVYNVRDYGTVQWVGT